MSEYGVVIAGARNAAFCAAHAAQENGARILSLECASQAENGGSSRFTTGAIRFALDGVEDIRALCPDLNEDQIAITDFGTYKPNISSMTCSASRGVALNLCCANPIRRRGRSSMPRSRICCVTSTGSSG